MNNLLKLHIWRQREGGTQDLSAAFAGGAINRDEPGHGK
jgi:hypothetical protein